MKRTIIALVAIAALAVLVNLPTMRHGLAVPVVHAQSGCSDATLTGNYPFVYTGFGTRGHTSKGPTNTPGAVVGVLTFDGSGNSTATYTAAFNGSVSSTSTPDVGTYTVNSDCTGNTSDTTAGVHFNFAISGGGAEILAIQTDPGNTATFDAKKQ